MKQDKIHDFRNRFGPWALIAGSAEGIGEGFTRVLASRGFNIIMIDRREESLARLAEAVQNKYKVQISTVLLDLEDELAAERIMDAIGEKDCRLLVYIAAYSKVKLFHRNTLQDLDRFININARGPLRLVYFFSNYLRKKERSGGILLISSLAGLIGPPFVAPYSATKAFNILLAESLSTELSEAGIAVSVCCSGTVSTPAYREGNPQFDRVRPYFMKATEVATETLDNLGKKTVIIPGWKNRMNYFLLTRMLPRKIAAGIVANAMRKMYPPGLSG